MSDRIRTIRRKKGEKKPEKTVETLAATEAQPAEVAPKKPKQKKKVPTGPRIDATALAEEANALGVDAMASLMSGAAPKDPEPGQQVSGTVASITKTTVFVNIGAKSEGVIDKDSLSHSDTLKVGDAISVFVVSAGARGIKLAEKLSGAGTKEMLEEAFRGKIPVEGVVESRNPGGFNVLISGVKAFCPASQIERHPHDDLDDYVGQKRVFIISEFKERDVVVSHRAFQESQAAEDAEKAWEQLKEGDVKEGTVVSVQDFGVFVELGGVQGLLHKSELGQGSDTPLPAKGEVLSVRIKTIDKAKDRISLGLQDQASGAWADIGNQFIEGEEYTGTVTRLMDFGAFVKLADGVEGMVHVSQMAEHRVDHPRSVVRSGQEVKVRVIEIDEDRKRIGLSMKKDGGDGRNTWKKHQRDQAKKQNQSLGTFADLLGDLKLS